MKHILTFFSVLLLAGYSYAQINTTGVNWLEFMKRQTMHWDSISTSYYTGMILGNGLLGTNIYKENDHAIRFDIGRTDVTDQREHGDPVLAEALFSRPRLPIGRMILKTSGKIIGAKLDLDIYNAVAKGIIYTTAGSIEFNSFVHAKSNVIRILVRGTKKEQLINWQFIAEKSKSPRMMNGNADNPKDYIDNPDFQFKKIAEYSICHQPLLNKGGYATVWYEGKGVNESVMLISVGYDPDGKQDETLEGINALKNFRSKKLSVEFDAHSKWWNQYYQQSFISIPDQRMESFYWIQLYKLAAATRASKPMIDLMGPWFTSKTPWPGVWWNLNTQLTYSPIFTSNHLELGRSLFNNIKKNIPNLINNVPEEWRQDAAAIGRISGYDLISPVKSGQQENGQFELGNLTWTMFYYHRYYAFSKDTTELRTFIYPLLKRSVNHLLHHLKKDEAGIYHLSSSFSPEYKYAEDANYALSSLRWGLNTLIALDAEHDIKDPDKEKWVSILEDLVSYPVNDTGLMIGKDVELTSSHRHYSHLLMIYPYHLINWDQTENRPLIERSLNHWLSLKGALQGYTFTGAASINAMMGKGDQAYELLNQLLDKYITPNTLYQESGPVIETPLSAATSIQEMLIQSWGEKIRVFPAVPAQWKNVAFDKLRTEGAFLVSAKMEDGVTSMIKVLSTKGGICQIQTDMKINMISSDKRNSLSFTPYDREGKTNLSFSTLPGETILLSSNYQLDRLIILPVKPEIHENWRWGL